MHQENTLSPQRVWHSEAGGQPSLPRVPPLSLLRVLPYCVQRVVLGQTHRIGARLAAGLAVGRVRGSR